MSLLAGKSALLQKPLEAILNNSERELIEQLVAKGSKYRGKAVVD